MRRAAYLIAVLAGAAPYAHGQGGDPKASVQQRLSSQFSLTEVAQDRSAVVNTGTLFTLQKDNLLLYSSGCPSSPLSTYKNGKLSYGFGHNFMRDLGGSMRMPGTSTTASCPQRRFTKGTPLWVTKIDVKKDGIVLQLYADSGILYYGDLRFPFEKGSVPAPDEALTMIAEVLAVQQASNSPQPAATPAPAPEPPPPPPPPAPALRLPSTYVSAQTPADQLHLNADNTFSLQEAGQTYGGTFAANGSALKLNLSGGPETTATIQGNNLTDASGQTWVLREQSAGTAPGGAMLRNEDVIKMAKAGFDDTIILAKISGSNCQFDTSTDALIQLKKGGASAAVLKAIMGAGH
jgi:hypothetical protein